MILFDLETLFILVVTMVMGFGHCFYFGTTCFRLVQKRMLNFCYCMISNLDQFSLSMRTVTGNWESTLDQL